jgi:hypothetical protein
MMVVVVMMMMMVMVVMMMMMMDVWRVCMRGQEVQARVRGGAVPRTETEGRTWKTCTAATSNM